ncbi:MAG: sulfatase family protein [Planctomycetota bacterium]
MDRPNIIFINTDQHSWNAVSAYGNTWVKTPNIDRLHRSGISFMRSYCTDPVCAPARASWMTGRYTSEIGVPFNGGSLHGDIPDLGELLKAADYGAYHCGKWHVDGRSVDRGFRNIYLGRRRIGAGGGEFYDPASTHAAMDFLARYDEREPFYLQVGYVNPHDVCEYLHNHEYKELPGPLAQGMVAEEDLPPLPPNFASRPDETRVQQVFRRGEKPLIHSAILNGVRYWDELQWRFMAWNYYRYIEKADHEIGLLLNTLGQTRFRDNTLIIFSVDHGEAAGCHGMFQKFTLYEESVRVPFIVAQLGGSLDVPRGRFDREHLVSGVDLLPTVCDYAGVNVPGDVRGLSVRPLVEGGGVEGRDTEWREHVYIQSNYWGRAVVTDRHKYVTEYRPREREDFVPMGPEPGMLGGEQIFDLETDPWETQNLSREPRLRGTLTDCRERMFAVESALDNRAIEAEHARKTILRWNGRLREAW